MKYSRLIEQKLADHFNKYKQAIVLLGPRQVGKTTIVKKIFPVAKYLLVDEDPIKNSLETFSSSVYRQLIGNSKEIIIDEAHLLSDPGRVIKLFYDQIPDIKIIVTGSSSLHIKNKTAESMAGRAIYYHLYPLTYSEYLYQLEIEEQMKDKILNKILTLDTSKSVKTYDQQEILNNILIYGQYPEILNNPKDENYLINLSESAIFKDIIELNLIDNRAKALELLKLLAFQIGNLISYSEIGSKLGIDGKTVLRYIEIFEQSFIIYRLSPFSSNKRNEIGKTPKIYFYDLGLRNALINNFQSVNVRSDIGGIFENFIITEVLKLNNYAQLRNELNYWRLKSGAEVDLVIKNNTQLIGVEIKYKKGKVSQAFLNKYPEALTHIVTSENFS